MAPGPRRRVPPPRATPAARPARRASPRSRPVPRRRRTTGSLRGPRGVAPVPLGQLRGPRQVGFARVGVDDTAIRGRADHRPVVLLNLLLARGTLRDEALLVTLLDTLFTRIIIAHSSNQGRRQRVTERRYVLGRTQWLLPSHRRSGRHRLTSLTDERLLVLRTREKLFSRVSVTRRACSARSKRPP